VSERGNSRRRAREGPGWFATLGGALLLVVVGFGVGLVAGAAFEEPGLVMDHLAGRTTDVPLPGGRERALLETSPRGSSTGSVPVKAARLGTPSVAAAPPSGPGHFAIQVGAFGSEASAQELARSLEGKGIRSFVAEEASGGARFKVRVGPLASRAKAEQMAARLKREHHLPTWILTQGRD